ncbi:glycosyltransferase family 2 protein [Jeotgalibaca sp. A122]|uniref:glycosyltransferase family 2 protein n=1 Tax=Jeotgalibaca sp. A122 TaxID=3457322 RepID=UPI003FD43C2D
MDRPIFSIIVPVYNTPGRFLRECLQTLREQTLPDIEIILINDGSTNESPTICEEIAERDPRIKLVHQRNKGVSSARNKGLDMAQGDWVIFVDPDDWVDVRMCEVAYEAITKSRRDIYIFPYWQDQLIREIAKYKGNSGIDLEHEEQIKIQLAVMDSNDEYTPHLIGSIWSKVYNHQFLESNHIRFKENLSMSEDLIFTLYAFEYAKKIGYIDYLFYHYRTNPNSVTKKYRSNIWLNIDKTLKEAKIFIESFNKDHEFEQGFYHLTTKLLKDNLMLDFFNENNPKKYSQRRREFNKLVNSSPYSEALQNINLDNSAKKKKMSILLLRHQNFFLLSKYYSYLRKKMIQTNK